MQCHSQGIAESGESHPIILVGNPNVGKSVVFGWLTGRYVEVSNYPGTTVEVARGTMAAAGDDRAPIIDTPGTNSLSPRSEDERVTRDILLVESPRAVLQVADAKNLRRALLLSTQLAELGVPLALDLNMADEAAGRGVTIDCDALSRKLGVPVTMTVATRHEGFDGLCSAIYAVRPTTFRVRFDEPIEAAVGEIASALCGRSPSKLQSPVSDFQLPTSDRALALMLLSGDASLEARLDGAAAKVSQVRRELATHYADPLGFVITRQRLAAVDALMEDVYHLPDARRVPWTEKFAALAVHPVWGVPVLLVVLVLMYLVVGRLGAGVLVDWMQNTVFGKLVNPWATYVAEALIPWPLVRQFFVGPYGLVTMALAYGLAIVLPIVTTFFIVFSFLEDSGYLPRLAVMVNRPFKAMGLNGKAVLPMVLGLGCDTMATRILETRKERIQVTLLLALGVPCSAQLGVLLGMMAGVSPVGIVVWLAVVTLTMMVVGWLAARLLSGQGSDFILELPPIRMPRLDNIVVKTLARLEWYLKEVLPLFVLGTAILFALDKTGVLVWIERMSAPLVVGLLGLPPQATDAFLIGFLRRDYGAAGLFTLARAGLMTPEQVVVSLIVITLFIPCIANLLVIVKEHGWKVAVGVVLTVFPLAFGVGALVHGVLHVFGWTF
jgi:ferrous iron transport protein B